MSESPLWDVQVAVMAVLAGVTGLPKVYDALPERTERPYGSWGTPVATDRRHLGRAGQRHSVILDWWGDATGTDDAGRTARWGYSQVLRYAALARAALDGKPLALPDDTMVALRWEQDVALPDPNNNVRHVASRYRIDTLAGA